MEASSAKMKQCVNATSMMAVPTTEASWDSGAVQKKFQPHEVRELRNCELGKGVCRTAAKYFGKMDIQDVKLEVVEFMKKTSEYQETTVEKMKTITMGAENDREVAANIR